MRRLTQALCVLCAFCCTLLGMTSSVETPDTSVTLNIHTTDNVQETTPMRRVDPVWLDKSDKVATKWEPKWPAMVDADIVRIREGREANRALYVDPNKEGADVETDDKGRIVSATGTFRDPNWTTSIVSMGSPHVRVYTVFDDDVQIPLTKYAYDNGWSSYFTRLRAYVADTGDVIRWRIDTDYPDPEDKAPAYVSIWAASSKDHGASVDLRLTLRNAGKDAMLNRKDLVLIANGATDGQS